MAKKVDLDVAEMLDITCRVGDTFTLTIVLKDGDGVGFPLVTDGYTFLMQVRNADQSILMGTKDAGDEQGIANFLFSGLTDTGEFNVSVTAAEMRIVPPGRYRYDLQYTVGGTTVTVLEGCFKVNPDISKAVN